ncbi:MAG: fructose-bisphosphatase class III, partial [Cellulosilyticum sp.]|nr:fructose-bisphosphatase class III [Cellulosilyticum sp.]
LHIVGDIFDRGSCPDKIIDLLMNYHSLDIEWGNHDILWMGAAAGNKACIANVIRNNIKYNNISVLENGYGISLRNLVLFGKKTYQKKEPMEAALKAISVILFKLEGQVIDRHPEYHMEHRKLLHHMDLEKGTVRVEGKEYALNDTDFPTINPDEPYVLSSEEADIIERLKVEFVRSKRLKTHIEFIYEKGSMYKRYNENLLLHGCVPLNEQGEFESVMVSGKTFKGKQYLDYAEKVVRRAYFGNHNKDDIDFMWYLWCGEKSPLCGRVVKTFERTFVADSEAWKEEENNYYKLYYSEDICKMILREFEIDSESSHIINGHTPVKTSRGEQPIRANGKLIVIDGGLCREYHKTTGIAGYTLIYNSLGLRIKAHQPFESVHKALRENKDIESSSEIVEVERKRVMVKDTDNGKFINGDIQDLERLLKAYREGEIEMKPIRGN